ncbi:MAG TPA: phosphoglycerate kinase [Candidatus Saccharibacteria bacterium]|nr:phosphoglycerate kinase [Candidatus Saccharibacteria bacterium]
MGLQKLTIRDIPVDGQTVLVRADYNVPLTEKGRVRDDLRIKASLPTIEYLLERDCKVVIIAHLGRPKGRDESLSLEPVAKRLSKLLDKPVKFVDEVFGDKVKMAVKKAPKKSVLLLENLRYYKGEEDNDAAFAKKIAESTGARYFVQDGFGVVHRAHASTAAITLNIPSVAGLLLEKEYETITRIIESPKQPFVAVFGGNKVADKIGMIERVIDKADAIIIGGAMANTFLNYKGFAMRSSLLERNQEAVLDKIYRKAQKKLDKNQSIEDFIILPSDVAVSKEIEQSAKRKVVKLGDLEPRELALDIGDASIERMVEVVSKAKTVIWNGTLGCATIPAFAHGSARLALTLATNNATSLIGGGDTADFVVEWSGGDLSQFTHVSTGGGASLELMAGEKLPGIECLLDKHKYATLKTKKA